MILQLKSRILNQSTALITYHLPCFSIELFMRDHPVKNKNWTLSKLFNFLVLQLTDQMIIHSTYKETSQYSQLCNKKHW